MEQLEYKVGFLGIPNSVHGTLTRRVEWNDSNIRKLKDLGFNAIQLNVAWGSRPDDEPLNLEDVVELTPARQKSFSQPVALRCNPSPERRRQRRADLRHRIEVCKKAGLRTIFHFGAPYNAHCAYGGNPPNCLQDPKVIRRHELLIAKFAREFPGVDDLLVYTYDQDAWLCSEFDDCPRCKGVPLHERLAPFLDALKKAWRRQSPRGMMWWEPWELSAGQVYRCVEGVEPKGFGLALHGNIAECQATLPVDRWFKNTCALARDRKIPVIAEYFLGGASEETEPYASLAHPLVVLRGLKALRAVEGVAGIKEYYGLAPNRHDPNLEATGLFFENPRISEDNAIRKLAQPYKKAAGDMAKFWKLTSSSMEFFPWDLSWFIREIGRSNPSHSLAAALLRGQQCSTPSWDSTRHAIFMKTDNTQPHPWMLEDIQIRCEMAADRIRQALALGARIRKNVPAERAGDFAENLRELAGFERRARAYAFHLRETNLAKMMRDLRKQGKKIPARMRREMLAVLLADQKNMSVENPAAVVEARKNKAGSIACAIFLFSKDLGKFLKIYFTETEDRQSNGAFSVTSR